MTRRYSVFVFFAILGLLVVGCNPTSSDDEEEEPEPTTYELTVSADPSEGGSVDPESGTYDEGEEVEVTATPADGWEFTGWSGDVESSDNPVTVTMDANTTITAEFSEGDEEPTTYDLTVNTDPSEGGSVDPSSGTFEEGEEVEVTATPAEGWEFTGWSGDVDSDENPVTVTMDANTTITAEFSEGDEEPTTYDLTVNADPSEGGSVDPESETVEEGEEVEVTATPEDGWEFTGWSGDVESSDNPVTVTMDSNTSITAEFSEISTYELTVSADPSEGGSVDPENETVEEGEEVEVTATPADGWEFTGWSGDVESSDNPVTVTMDANTTITAEFSEITYDLTVNTDPSEGGSVDPSSGTFEEGEEVEVTATPADGWEFSGWSGDVDSDENPVTVTMDANTNITAEFSEIPTYELAVNASPSEGGSVSPSSDTYQEGEEVEITATSSEGWSFNGWSGTDSESNPLTVTMTGDTELTANFREDARPYTNQIEVSDGQYSETLSFGMHNNATDGFDDGLDDEAPPAPPQGSFYGNFVITDYSLYEDFRPVTRDKTEWELNFDGDGNNNVTLSWDFSSSDHAGTLTLVDDPDNPSFEIDMEDESSHQVTDSSVEVLYIIQE